MYPRTPALARGEVPPEGSPMHESGPNAERSVPPVVPPVSGVLPAAEAEAGAPRRSRAWVYWTVAAVVLVGILIASCAIPFALISKDSGSKARTTGWGMGSDAVAVIRIDGVIAGTGDYYSGYITPDFFYDQFDQATEDESVKAIVLKVDSPGGTVAASEEIASYVESSDKPVVVSTGDVNASGAYMISSQADEIWALPGSAIGSIGVISQIPNASGLLEKLGVEFQVITAGENKDTGSLFRPLTDEERSLIQGQVDEVYEQFIDIVAKGRGMERSKVEELATGWTWSGEKAKTLGLVDRIGTHQDALDAAAKAGGIKGDYDVVTYEADSFDDLFRSVIGFQSVLKGLSATEALAPGAAVRESLPR